jgi:hypothetical protein
MPKVPKIDHEYHAAKDKLTIKIRGYSLSKKTRTGIMEKLVREVERKPDRLIAEAKKSRKGNGKMPRGRQKASKLIEIGD